MTIIHHDKISLKSHGPTFSKNVFNMFGPIQWLVKLAIGFPPCPPTSKAIYVKIPFLHVDVVSL
jgi:hypothetical protein